MYGEYESAKSTATPSDQVISVRVLPIFCQIHLNTRSRLFAFKLKL